MSSPSSKAQIAPARNTLREKFNPPMFDSAALGRAEQALQALSAEFAEWMTHEVERIAAAQRAARASDYAEADLASLYGCAHDIKGLGATYDYPLATQIAASLCRLLETPAARARARARPAIVDAHIDAIRAAVTAGVKTKEHPVGRELLAALEAQVATLTNGLPPTAHD